MVVSNKPSAPSRVSQLSVDAPKKVVVSNKIAPSRVSQLAVYGISYHQAGPFVVTPSNDTKKTISLIRYFIRMGNLEKNLKLIDLFMDELGRQFTTSRPSLKSVQDVSQFAMYMMHQEINNHAKFKLSKLSRVYESLFNGSINEAFLVDSSFAQIYFIMRLQKPLKYPNKTTQYVIESSLSLLQGRKINFTDPRMSERELQLWLKFHVSVVLRCSGRHKLLLALVIVYDDSRLLQFVARYPGKVS